jgi:hypothetical protein
MPNAITYRSRAFPHRPWILGQLYDVLSRETVLHLDAHIMLFGGRMYLDMYWSAGGTREVARDVYLIEPDGLTPVWDMTNLGKDVYWSKLTHKDIAPVHAAVVARAREVERTGRWARVSVQAHYVHAGDECLEPGAGAYKPPKAREGRARFGGIEL